MNEPPSRDRADYYRAAASWSDDRVADLTGSRRIAWIVAAVAALVAVLLAITLAALVPLKTAVPYVLMVDRQTGYVTTVDPLDRTTLTADAALTRSFVAQYVIAREGYDIDSLREDYRKVALWSAEEARSRYIDTMAASNPQSPLAVLPRRAIVDVQLRSISSLSATTALVRFTTVRTDPGGQAQAPQYWAAIVRYRFSAATMSAEDRLVNPLGFQVVRYRRNAETLPDPANAPLQPTGAGASSAGAPSSGAVGAAAGRGAAVGAASGGTHRMEAIRTPAAPVLARGPLPQPGEWVGSTPR